MGHVFISFNHEEEQVAVALQHFLEKQHKVPHPYSRADDCARSLTGFGMTNAKPYSKA
jgi:hypothetical protein